MSAMRTTATADQPDLAPSPRRPDQLTVHVAPEAYRQLKELAQITGRTNRDLMAEAITRLAVAHDQPVEPELRKKFRRIALGLE